MNSLGLRRPFGNPFDNNKAQIVELAGDLERARHLVRRFMDEGIETEPPAAIRPRAASGTAGVEAPRGLLVHSYQFDEAGVVTAADVITPTAMNAGSIEEKMREAIARTPRAPEGEMRARLEMLVRAYDPCISCSVHSIRI
jgi:sulfhydrogenase subunit alpha